jgi:hypothetical protein
VRCVWTSIKPGRHVALERSTTVTPPGVKRESAEPTAVIVPPASKTMTWSTSVRPERASRSLPQRTAPGAPRASGDATRTARSANRNWRIGTAPLQENGWTKHRSIHLKRTVGKEVDRRNQWCFARTPGKRDRRRLSHTTVGVLVGAIQAAGQRWLADLRVPANERIKSTSCQRCASVRRFLNEGMGLWPSLIL